MPFSSIRGVCSVRPIGGVADWRTLRFASGPPPPPPSPFPRGGGEDFALGVSQGPPGPPKPANFSSLLSREGEGGWGGDGDLCASHLLASARRCARSERLSCP